MGPGLIDRAKRGDKEAFGTLALQLGDRLYSVAYRILRDAGRAEDAVQQTFLIAWRELPTLPDDSRLEAWLYRLLVNACYAEIRHTRRWQPGLRLVPLEVPFVEDAQVSVARRDELERAFRREALDQTPSRVPTWYVYLASQDIPDGMSFDAWVALHDAATDRAVPCFESVGSYRTQRVDGETARLGTKRCDDFNGSAWATVQILVVHRGRGYAMYVWPAEMGDSMPAIPAIEAAADDWLAGFSFND